MKPEREPATFTDYVLCALLLVALALGFAYAA
jgi:hypothetical protein